jgi:glycosyltransferase involved in cell wall biosynthesis
MKKSSSPASQFSQHRQVSLIVTVLNEESSILDLLKSIAAQKKLPHETIIVDGGSSDDTFKLLENFASSVQGKLIGLKVFQELGNRSVGRNFAISQAKFTWIAITDAGCTLDEDWLPELLKQAVTGISVVAGYYRGVAENSFQTAVIPYALVMPNQIQAQQVFLPATRSMMIKKSVWQQVGGFNEELSHNEDYEFALRLAKVLPESSFSFAKKAIVNWQPPATIFGFTNMIYRFAKGDLEAGIFRPKVGLVFLRYLLLAGVVVFSFKFQVAVVWWLLGFGVLGYLGWAVAKNYKSAAAGWYWLPLLQLLADKMVIFGSITGVSRWLQKKFR